MPGATWQLSVNFRIMRCGEEGKAGARLKSRRWPAHWCWRAVRWRWRSRRPSACRAADNPTTLSPALPRHRSPVAAEPFVLQGSSARVGDATGDGRAPPTACPADRQV